ncbi:AEC family transporter [Cysteiniphilum sp. JM-1]|uniref:AEC family transporter n=1 Tax=Cysteiniphilum sp. JM-1 TaxID=2610891 RepID=UPI0012482503|nr:AEC family transporter [Cysteiniphilum sp. JM-1]
MFSTILNALIPVAFVIFLGWLAGFFKIIDNKHSKSFATYVMNFSFPCLLFIITATTKLDTLLNIKFVIAFFIGLMGMYLISFCTHKFLLKRSPQTAAQGAFVCSFPDMAFMGIPIFIELIGSSVLVSIVIGNIISSVVMIPVTVILLELRSGNKANLSQLFISNIVEVLKKPLVFAPILGIIYAVIGVPLPKIIEDSLKLIGNTTSGVSLFALGLIMSSFVIKFSKGAVINIFLKNLIHPLIMIALVYGFGITGILAKEVILLCAMPTATMTTMFALRYNTLTEESTSSTILGTLIAIITLPVFMLFVGF